jgi:hypothetical protein
MATFEYTSGAVEETIDFASGDSADFYQVELIGGIDYVATALGASNAGGTLQDPYLVLYDSAGNPIASADNSLALGSDPLLEFQAPTTDIYYVGVSDNVGSGTYTFVLDQAGEPVFFGGTESFGTFGG